MLRWIIFLIFIGLIGGLTYYLYRERYKYQFIAAVDGILLVIVLLLFLLTGKKDSKTDVDKEDAPSENQVVSENVIPEPVKEEEKEEVPEEPEKIVYHDLSLEEAWNIVNANTVTMHGSSAGINVRSKPTTNSEKVGMINQDSVVYIICDEDTDDGYTWSYVIFEKMASGQGKDNNGDTMYTIENKYYLGYIRKDLLR